MTVGIADYFIAPFTRLEILVFFAEWLYEELHLEGLSDGEQVDVGPLIRPGFVYIINYTVEGALYFYNLAEVPADLG